jgi:hypothetical protein
MNIMPLINTIPDLLLTNSQTIQQHPTTVTINYSITNTANSCTINSTNEIIINHIRRSAQGVCAMSTSSMFATHAAVSVTVTAFPTALLGLLVLKKTSPFSVPTTFSTLRICPLTRPPLAPTASCNKSTLL